jgi:hypothetical protein
MECILNDSPAGKYPVASGTDPKTPNQPVEGKNLASLRVRLQTYSHSLVESANMLIMALAAARLSGNGNQLNNHVRTLTALFLSDSLTATSV